MSQRICFQLRVRPELLDDYILRHADVWPEMRAALTEAGWRNYSLFLTGTRTLIGYFECDDLATAQAAMAAVAAACVARFVSFARRTSTSRRSGFSSRYFASAG